MHASSILSKAIQVLATIKNFHERRKIQFVKYVAKKLSSLYPLFHVDGSYVGNATALIYVHGPVESYNPREPERTKKDPIFVKCVVL